MDETPALLDAGKADFAAMLAASLPGATLYEKDGLAWVDCGLPDSTFNYVYRAPTSHTGFARAVVRATEHFRQRRLPFHWSVGLRAEPPRATETLARNGFRFDYAEPCMQLELNAPRDATAHAPGLQIVPVTSSDLLRQWMLAWGCGAPAEVIEAWYRVYAALPYGPHGALRMFLATLAHEPVATVYLHLVQDTATVHYVVTCPPFRRRGIGAVMTEFAVREARAAGCRIAVLTASPLGAGIYRRLGFRETGLISQYQWSPDWARSA
jgi:GNAT superfamily N-acetyltransferase